MDSIWSSDVTQYPPAYPSAPLQCPPAYPSAPLQCPPAYPQPDYDQPATNSAHPVGPAEPQQRAAMTVAMAAANSAARNVALEDAFSDKSIRRGFLRKVFGILACQLAISGLFIVLFLYVDVVREYSAAHPGLYIAACVATVVMVIVMGCCPNVRRNWPINIICLFVFTIAQSWLLGSIASYYEAKEVLMAVGITTLISVALVVFAMQTKIDFTALSGFLFVATICLLMFGILAVIFKSEILNVVYASVGALIFSLWIVYDVQAIMGGKKRAISPEEYIFAALNLYLDVVNLFLFILRLVSDN